MISSSPGRPQTLDHSEQQRSQAALAWQIVRQSIAELRWRYGLFVLLTLGLGLIALLPPELFRQFSTGLIDAKTVDVQVLMTELAWFGGLVAAALLISTFGSILAREWLRLSVEANLRRRVLVTLHDLPLEAYDGAERGEWLTRMTSDLGSVESFITESLPNQMRSLAILIGAASLFVWHFGPLAAVPLVAAIGIASLNYWIQVKLAPVLGELRSLNGGIVQSLIENFEGKKTIRSQGAEEEAQDIFNRIVSSIKATGLRVVRTLGGLLGGNEFTSQAVITAVLCWMMLLVSQQDFTIGTALLVPFYIGMFFNAAQNLASGGYDWNRFFAEGGRLADLLLHPEQQTREAQPDLTSAKTLHFNHLEVGHRIRKPGPTPSRQTLVAAGPLSARFQRGELWAITGESGCGKSTLLEVLAGLRQALAGHVWIADQQANTLWAAGPGQGVVPPTIAAYVEQTPFIFAGSFRANLCFGGGDANDDALWQAVDAVALTGYVQGLGGLDGMLSDAGRDMSQGQRYRLALARALLSDRPFLMLDEPFAALDPHTTKVVVNTLNELRRDRGIIVVTHMQPDGLNADHTLHLGQRMPQGANPAQQGRLPNSVVGKGGSKGFAVNMNGSFNGG